MNRLAYTMTIVVYRGVVKFSAPASTTLSVEVIADILNSVEVDSFLKLSSVVAKTH